MKLRNNYFHLTFKSASLIVLAISFLTLGLIFTKDAFAEDPSANNDQRLVTIHDGDKEVTILTKAGTVGEALKQAEIDVEDRDIVEPATSFRMIAKSYQVNVFRARPVIVVDNAKQIKVMTAEQSPKQIAKAASVTIYDEDITQFKRVDSILNSGGASVQMVIDRAVVFSFNQYGKTFEARTQAETVGGLLKEKGIVLGPNDGVSPSFDTLITPGMSVKVWRDGKQTITQEEVVARPVEEIKDVDQPVGSRTIREEGSDGKRNATYEVEMRDGVEVSRKEIASVVTVAPVKQVVVVGVKTLVAPYTGSGNKDEWLAASGIPREEWGYVDSIVQRESGWNPNAINKSSGACGLAQALPCSKVPGNPYNPVDSLRWMNAYVNGRYYDGSPYTRGVCSGITSRWACAYTFWNVYHWY